MHYHVRYLLLLIATCSSLKKFRFVGAVVDPRLVKDLSNLSAVFLSWQMWQ